jgi:hypothetical protein
MDLARVHVIDYVLLPVAGFPKQRVEFSCQHQARLEACRFDTVDALIAALSQKSRITFGRGRPKNTL